jgi:hypothetical protein
LDVERWRLDGAWRHGIRRAPLIVFVLSGALNLRWNGGQKRRFGAGQTVLVPAALDATLEAEAGGATLLHCEPRAVLEAEK